MYQKFENLLHIAQAKKNAKLVENALVYIHKYFIISMYSQLIHNFPCKQKRTKPHSFKSANLYLVPFNFSQMQFLWEISIYHIDIETSDKLLAFKINH